MRRSGLHRPTGLAGLRDQKSPLAMDVAQVGSNGLLAAAYQTVQCQLATEGLHALRTNRRRHYRGKRA